MSDALGGVVSTADEPPRVNINKYRSDGGGRALPSMRECSEAGRLDLLVAQVLQEGEDGLHKNDTEGGGCIHQAAKNGHMTIIEFLLEKRVSINAPAFNTGMTPIMFAAEKGHDAATIRQLIAAGADVSLQDLQGKTALTYALHKPLLAHLFSVKGAPVSDIDLAHCILSQNREGIIYLLENHRHALDLSREVLPSTPSKEIQKVLAHFEPSLYPSVKGSLAVDNSNLPNLLKKDKVIRALAAAILPNLSFAVAALLPGIFGFVALAANLYGVQAATYKAAKSRSPDPGLAGWYAGALMFGSCVLITQVFPHVDAPRAKLAWEVITTIMFYCYLKAMISDPGVIVSTKESRKQCLDYIQNGYDIEYTDFCPTTMVRKPNRAKFCSTSKKLVSRFDHYCVWTSNTIGAGNHRPFYFFTVCQVISQFLVLYFSLSFLKLNTLPSYALCDLLDYLFDTRRSLVTYFLFLYNIAVILFILSVFVIQSWYIHRNVTSNEIWFSQRYSWCFNIGSRTYTLYNKGPWQNWKDFLLGRFDAGYEPPPIETNQFLRTLLSKYESYQVTDGTAQLFAKQPPPMAEVETPQVAIDMTATATGSSVPVAAPVHQPTPASVPKVDTNSGNCVDEETGFIYPVQLKEKILSLPLESRLKLARKQQADFQQHNVIDDSGKVSLPTQPDQDALLTSTAKYHQEVVERTQSDAPAPSVARLEEETQPNIPAEAVTRNVGGAQLRSVSVRGKKSE
eukprot:TRINITY_DN3478_c0_g4_i1.p1 TRINITY_DN3478_c0_g4~~TRINITY_DN3478_c0_g4_i1.p1  ORF type:complete len:737 (+),score=152.18 TRINITY_DN3478_c0_g4_i1:40-2250(+)